MKVKKSIKKSQLGSKISGSIPKGVKVDTAKTISSMNKYTEKPKRDSVESEMFPGKMIPKPKSNYENGNFDKMFKPAPKKKAKSGASLKPVPEDKKGNLGKLPTAVRNKMGFQKDGGKTKAKGGAKVAKKMMGGGKCKYGC